MNTKPLISFKNVTKYFGTTPILKGIDLEIRSGKMTAIIGRSGEGKSVLLKHMIGLMQPTSGSIEINGINITTASALEQKAAQKLFGYVFQFAALLDSLTIYENIGITLLEQGISDDDVLPIVLEKLKLVQLDEGILYNYPSQLSGGMRKRVGIARTLVSCPKIILYDEPTTGLDPITTRIIHELMYTMQKELNITSIVVSHDLDLLNYADNVAMIYDGIIVWQGSAQEAQQSENPYIRQFIQGDLHGPIPTGMQYS